MFGWRVGLFATWLMAREVGEVVRTRPAPEATRAVWGPMPWAVTAAVALLTGLLALLPVLTGPAALALLAAIRLRIMAATSFLGGSFFCTSWAFAFSSASFFNSISLLSR